MSIYIVGFGIACSVLLNIILAFKRDSDCDEFSLISYMAKLNLVGVILELACLRIVRGDSSSLLLSSLIVRFYLLYMMAFLLLFTLYIYTVSYKTAKDEKIKYYRVLSKLVFFVFYIASAVMIFIPIKIYNGYASGQAFDYVYLCSIVTMAAWVISLIKNIGKVEKKKFIPIGIFILLTSLALVPQRFSHTLNFIASLHVIVMFSFLMLIRRKTVFEEKMVEKKGEQFDLQEVLNEVVNQAKNKIAEKSIQLNEVYDVNLPEYLCGDGQALKQICTNVLSCLIDYTSVGSIEFKVDCILRDMVCKLVMTINSTGVYNFDFDKILLGQDGKQDEEMPQIRGFSETKKLIGDLGGKLVIQGGLGVGTTFIISIEEKIGKNPKIEI